MHEFAAWPKTARLFRDIVVTEKIDGTNAAIHATPVADWEADLIRSSPSAVDGPCVVHVDDVFWAVSAQSRKRIITPGKTTDNYGFAGWVYENAAALVRLLGEGLHFGEWWGQGIQRNYGMACKHFSLFNTERYAGLFAMVGDSMVQPVPTLYQGPNDTAKINECLRSLAAYGSVAVNGWPTPEGICVYHSASRSVSKVTLDNNDAGKWEGA